MQQAQSEADRLEDLRLDAVRGRAMRIELDATRAEAQRDGVDVAELAQTKAARRNAVDDEAQWVRERVAFVAASQAERKREREAIWRRGYE